MFSLSETGRALPQCRDVKIVDELRQIWLPYIPYAFYMYGLWFGVVWPATYCLAQWAARDWHQLAA